MKKFIAFVLALTMVLTTFTVVSAAEPFSDRDELNIVYLGGSITEGGKTDTCWVSLIGKEFANRFPDKTVNNFNVGIGGTGSEFGIFRLKRDVIEHDPGIVFVEFAVNDRATAKESSQKHMEGIVRQLMSLEKQPVIIFVYTALADKKYPDDRPDNYDVTPPPCVETHEEIAQYYNIPSINLQDYIWNEVLPNKENFPGVENVHSILPDAVHPQVLGNKIYADYIWKCISENEDKFFQLPTPQETPMTGYEYKGSQMIPASGGTYTGNWEFSATSQTARVATKMTTSEQGATATFQFSGPAFTVFVDRVADGGTLSYSIDGGAQKTVSCASATAGIAQLGLDETLEDKDHTVVFKNVDGKPVNIAAIGVDQEFDVNRYPDFIEFNEDFENFDAANWTTFLDTANYSIENGAMKVSAKDKDWAEFNVDTFGSGVTNISFDVNRENQKMVELLIKTGTGEYTEIFGLTNDNRGAFLRDPDQKAVLAAANGGDALVPLNTTVHVKVQLDFLNKTVRLFLDGKEAQYSLEGNSLPNVSLSSSFGNISGIALRVEKEGVATFDNIQVTDERSDLAKDIENLPDASALTLEDKAMVNALADRCVVLENARIERSRIPGYEKLQAAIDAIYELDVFAREVNLQPNTVENKAGSSQILTYKDVDNFTSKVTGVYVNGVQLTSDQYEFRNSKLWISGRVFPAAGTYKITITIDGQDDLEVNQQIIESGIVYMTSSDNCTKSETDWYGSPSINGYQNTPTSYTTSGDGWVQWQINDAGTFDVSVWKVCHPSAGTKFLMVDVKHKDGLFTTENPLNCIGEISTGAFESVGTFTFAGDGTEYVKIYLGEGHDAAFLRADSIRLSGSGDPDDKSGLEYSTDVTVSDLTQSGTKVTANVKNNTKATIEKATIICAVFNEGNLEQIKLIESPLNGGETKNMEFDFINPTDGKTVKVFVWDSLDATQPIN